MRGHGWRRGLRACAPAVAIAALLGVAGQAQAQAPLQCNGGVSLCDRPLNRVVIPATHNSMSAASEGFALPNQPLGIAAQLKAGVRGFLIDVHYGHKRADGVVVTDSVKTADSGVYLCHEFCELGATPLAQGLRQMRKRLDRARGDVLVLDVEDYVSTADLAASFRRSGLNQYVYRGAPGPTWPTLRQMIARHQQVVVLTEHRADGVPWIHLDYAGIVQETPYTWATPSLLTDPANQAASCVPNRGGTTGSLFLLNHWSPPLAPDPATSARVNAVDVLVGRAATCARVRGALPNLIAVDWYTAGDLFRAVAILNAISYHLAPAPPGA
jgi:hypothetical protein